eukprot:14682293-Ditylum_brightwellii.AAC.1
MRPTIEWDDTKTVDDYLALFGEEVDDDEMENELFTSEIKDAKYDTVTPEEVSWQQDYLSSMQRHVLEQVLDATPTLFDGKLGQ